MVSMKKLFKGLILLIANVNDNGSKYKTPSNLRRCYLREPNPDLLHGNSTVSPGNSGSALSTTVTSPPSGGGGISPPG